MAFDAFLKIDGIDGESTDKGHPGSIEIESFSWGVGTTQPSASNGAGAGRATLSDMHIVKTVDKSSPKLFLIAVSGKTVSGVQLSCRKAGRDQQEFLTVTLTNATISSFQEGGNRHGGEFPTEEITFSFQKIEMNVS